MSKAETTEILNLPDAAVEYIAFQRTEVLRFRRNRAYATLRKLLPASFYNYCVRREARRDKARIKAFYAAEIEREFSTIRAHLPLAAQAILDIGCGVAGIDVLLDRHYAAMPDLYLLDKSATETSVFYGFKSTGAFYNSLETACDVLVANGIDRDRIFPIEATADKRIATERRFDLVVSLISWGFHYPVETYLARVHEALNPGGCLILDVRKQTGGLDQLRQRFASVETIVDEPKFERVLARR